MKALSKFILFIRVAWIPIMVFLILGTLLVLGARGVPPSQPIINRLTTACVPHDGVYEIKGWANDTYRVLCNSGHKYTYWVLNWEEKYPRK